jgi:putative inorganic carbon (HCO3(-)) transporter
MNFGLSGAVPALLYVGGIVALWLTIFRNPIAGLFYLIPLIPLQTMRYSMNGYPFAKSIIVIVELAVVIGLKRLHRPILPQSPWKTLLCVYGGYTLFSLVLGTFIIGTPFPFPGEPRFGVWEDYMSMPVLLLLVAAVGPSKRQVQVMVLMMCISTLMLSHGFYSAYAGRDFSSYSNDLRGEGGAMGYAGINGLAAYEAAFSTLLLGLAAFERRWLLKIAYYGIALYSSLCLMYALSRGAYIAAVLGWLFIGVVKNRLLLVTLIIASMSWTALVPKAVQERVFMTQDSSGDLDHSSELRVMIWEDALDLFASANALLGMGFNTYAYLHRVGTYEDTHNIFLKVLIETGVVGMCLFLWLLGKAFRTGFRCFRLSDDPLYASLGLGLAGWLLCATVASCFGDRWMYFQVNGYMWVIGGIVAYRWRVDIEGVDGQTAFKEGDEEAFEEMEPVPAFS